ncbi:MAG TPA: hypothetical protein VII59_13935 [Streptosporangiaceae bacterium]
MERIDHGVNCLEDAALMARLAADRIGLTVCPVSNGWVIDSRKVRELGAMLDQTLLATVNSDDPAYFEAYVNENFAAVAADGGLGTDQLTQLARNSFEIAWLDPAGRAGYLASIDSYVTGRPAPRARSAETQRGEALLNAGQLDVVASGSVPGVSGQPQRWIGAASPRRVSQVVPFGSYPSARDTLLDAGLSVKASLSASRAPSPAKARCSTAARISVPIPRPRWPGASHEKLDTVPNLAKSDPFRFCIPIGSPSTSTTKYSRQKLSSTRARPAQIPRSHRHSRSGLSAYNGVGSSNGHGATSATPARTTGTSRSSNSSGRPGQRQPRRPHLKVQRRIGVNHSRTVCGLGTGRNRLTGDGRP